jgi:hypothetical protein
MSSSRFLGGSVNYSALAWLVSFGKASGSPCKLQGAVECRYRAQSFISVMTWTAAMMRVTMILFLRCNPARQFLVLRHPAHVPRLGWVTPGELGEYHVAVTTASLVYQVAGM